MSPVIFLLIALNGPSGTTPFLRQVGSIPFLMLLCEKLSVARARLPALKSKKLVRWVTWLVTMVVCGSLTTAFMGTLFRCMFALILMLTTVCLMTVCTLWTLVPRYMSGITTRGWGPPFLCPRCIAVCVTVRARRMGSLGKVKFRW